MLNKSLTIQLTELTVTSIPKGRFVLNILRTIVCEGINDILNSGIINNVEVTYNYDSGIIRDSIYHEQEWMNIQMTSELFTVKQSLQRFVMEVIDRFHISDLKENNILNFNVGLVTNNLVVISFNIVEGF